jgi:hypothetical protein
MLFLKVRLSFYCIEVIFAYYFLIFNIQEDLHQNASVVQNLRIDYDESIDCSKQFPAFFNLTFNEFDRDFCIEFVKVLTVHSNNKTHSYDFYVMDKSTGHPVKKSIDVDEEEFELYREKDGRGSATMIRNRKNSANQFRIVKFYLTLTLKA